MSVPNDELATDTDKMCIYTVYYIHIKWFWCYILYEFNWIYMIFVAHCRFHNCGWLWPSKIIGLVPLHDFLQAFHRFGHHIGHFLRSGAPLGFDLQQATHFRNPRLMMNLMPSTHLALRKKWSVAECFRPTAGFVGESEAFVQSPCLRTPQPGAPPALRCWLTTDWSQVPKFDGFQSLYADEWSIYIYITVIFDQW
jgi:hypothetical protein